MARRRKFTETSPLRYTYKAVRLHGGTPSAALLDTLGQLQQTVWSKNFGIYRDIYEIIKPVLQRLGVPPGQWGLYRSFAFVVEKEVRQRGAVDLNEIIARFQRRSGLDPGVMGEIAGVLGVEAPKEGQPRPQA
jgi:hypothetical protein